SCLWPTTFRKQDRGLSEGRALSVGKAARRNLRCLPPGRAGCIEPPAAGWPDRIPEGQRQLRACHAPRGSFLGGRPGAGGTLSALPGISSGGGGRCCRTCCRAEIGGRHAEH